jgi:hypothetical protein
VIAVGHIPARPNWMCTACAEAWPCVAKRARLLEEHADAPASLRVLMAMRLADAAGDLGSTLAVELHSRFLGWVPGVEAASRPTIFRPYVAHGRWPTNEAAQ